MSQPRTLIYLLLGVSALLCAILVVLAPPVLFHLNVEPSALNPSYVVVQNPFRDRGPEAAADAFLLRLKAGDTESLKTVLCYPDKAESILESEVRFPIQAWRLNHRQDDLRGTGLSYKVMRRGGYGPEYSGNAELLLSRSPRGWQVRCFNAWY